MNARALQDSDFAPPTPGIDPIEATLLTEDSDGAARGSIAILATMAAMALTVIGVVVAVVVMVRRSRARSSVVADLPKKAVDVLHHAAAKLSDIAA